jgi:maltooligosyltrehalose trehalohydrolase
VIPGSSSGTREGVQHPRVWAPDASHVDLVRNAADRGPSLPLRPDLPGWWVADADMHHGERYAFSLDDGPPRPDPRSVWQPDGVHSPSAAYDHSLFRWRDARWRGRELRGGVIYEAHVGTLTPEGTLDAAIRHLHHLQELGADFIELMPVAAFDGDYGWGYDGVALWAVHEPYGGPDALKRFVDAAHVRGLGVILDVVYNHLGPSGNYLAEFGPYFTDMHRTPWGSAINLDGPGSDEVRAFLLENALSWLRDFHVDGLRLDAVHALMDERAVPYLEELSASVDHLADELGRPLILIAESDRNDPTTVTRRGRGGLGLDAQWDDDVHHALHVALTGETYGYYKDFDVPGALAKVYAGAFFHDGTWSSFRGRSHGRPVIKTGSRAVAPWQFVTSLQTHDQVGNRAEGARLSALVEPGLLAGGAALLLLGPFTPMLFMGEEWGASTPWRYFTSFPDDALGHAVSEGRRLEFTAHGWSAEDVPDPQNPKTREVSVLEWSERLEEGHAQLLRWYTDLITVRRSLAGVVSDNWDAEIDREGHVIVMRRPSVVVVCNLGTGPVPMPELPGTPLLRWPADTPEGSSAWLLSQSVLVLRPEPPV